MSDETQQAVEAARYRKRPVVVEAMQFTAASCAAVCEWMGIDHEETGRCGFDTPLIIETLEGEMRAVVGDWIIKGVQGEFYPCKPDIFEATYETATTPAKVQPDSALRIAAQAFSDFIAMVDSGMTVFPLDSNHPDSEQNTYERVLTNLRAALGVSPDGMVPLATPPATENPE